jgi:hypothetical protein
VKKEISKIYAGQCRGKKPKGISSATTNAISRANKFSSMNGTDEEVGRLNEFEL